MTGAGDDAGGQYDGGDGGGVRAAWDHDERSRAERADVTYGWFLWGRRRCRVEIVVPGPGSTVPSGPRRGRPRTCAPRETC